MNYKSDFVLTLTSDAGWAVPFRIKFWTAAPRQAYFAGWDGETWTHCAYDPAEPTKLKVQFDDHRLTVGELRYEISYHFAMADFPDDTEDEVLNRSSVVAEVDGMACQVVLDFQGETAPDIQFALPAYANELQRIASEAERVAVEQQREANEAQRVENEQQRMSSEQGRTEAETRRAGQWDTMSREAATVIGEAGNVNAELDGTVLTVTNREGESRSVNTKGVSGGFLFPQMDFDPETGILTVRGLQQEVQRISYDEETAQLIIRL